MLAEGRLDEPSGLVGDNWNQRYNKHHPEGLPDPDRQLNVINARLSALVAVDPDRRALAGDQLHSTSTSARPTCRWAPGWPWAGRSSRSRPSPTPAAPSSWSASGKDAMRFVNSPEGRALRLRGLNARVVVAGPVRPGDPVRKLSPTVPASLSSNLS